MNVKLSGATKFWLVVALFAFLIGLAMYDSMGWAGPILMVAIVVILGVMFGSDEVKKYLLIGIVIMVVLFFGFIGVNAGGPLVQQLQAMIPTATPVDCAAVNPVVAPANVEFKAKRNAITVVSVLVNNQLQKQPLVSGQSYWPKVDMLVYEYPVGCQGYVDNMVTTQSEFWLAVSPTQTPTPIPSPTAPSTTTLTPDN